ncbi:MAG: DUF1330 domain-containing protein [Bacteroidales bacterium]|nr:DUF1330 domain-containing protein [Bacteroidales bacterium]
MEYYFIANIRINNPEEYQKYLDKVDEVSEMYDIEYLAVDEAPQILEGNWKYTKSVLIKFSSKEEFERWYYSREYQDILKHRLRSADCDTILVKGLE